MSRGTDWSPFVRRHWEKAPARLSLTQPVVTPELAFRNAITVSEPYRFGTRFRALPDVRFFVERAQLRSPGTLLPGTRERDVDSYVRRVATRLKHESFQLSIEQPFLFDFPLWDEVRSFLRELLERIGVPVLPIVSELLLGNFVRSPRGVSRRPHHALFILVLHGRMRVRLWKKLWGDSPNETADFDRHLAEATTLEAEAGDVLYIPSRLWHLEECEGPCMAVRLWVPVQGSRPTDAVKELLVTLLERRLPEDDSVPYLDFSWQPRGNAPTPVEPLVRAAQALEELARGPDMRQALRIIWTRRVSACGLEPAPPPRERAPLEDATLVRAVPRSPVVRMQDSPGLWIWAVNGHAFPVLGNPHADEVLESLASGDARRVGELCRLARRGARREELRELLETLHSLRALEVVSGEEG